MEKKPNPSVKFCRWNFTICVFYSHWHFFEILILCDFCRFVVWNFLVKCFSTSFQSSFLRKTQYFLPLLLYSDLDHWEFSFFPSIKKMFLFWFLLCSRCYFTNLTKISPFDSTSWQASPGFQHNQIIRQKHQKARTFWNYFII